MHYHTLGICIYGCCLVPVSNCFSINNRKSTMKWDMSEAEPAGLGQSENQGGGRVGTDPAAAQLWCSREGRQWYRPSQKWLLRGGWGRTSLLAFFTVTCQQQGWTWPAKLSFAVLKPLRRMWSGP